LNIPQNLDSKFRFILVAARRARQLQSGAKPLLQTASKKSTRVAQQEVSAGLVPVDVFPLASDNGSDGKKKSAK